MELEKDSGIWNLDFLWMSCVGDSTKSSGQRMLQECLGDGRGSAGFGWANGKFKIGAKFGIGVGTNPSLVGFVTSWECGISRIPFPGRGNVFGN